MKRACLSLLIVVVLAGCLVAQHQANTPTATLLVNGAQGPPYPIVGVQLPTGVMAVLQISGMANAPIVLALASGVSPVGLPTPFGLYDLDWISTGILANGLEPGSTWRTDPNGLLVFAGVVPSTTPTGVTTAYQAAVADTGAPSGYTLTAATEFTITQGVVTQTLPMGDDTFANVSLTQYGFSIPFYTQTYTDFYVASNGFISFGQGSTDFTPTPAEFNSQMPRICSFWCDLAPNQGGQVVVHIVPPGIPPPISANQVGSATYFNPYSPLPVDCVRVEFNNIQEFGAGPTHTFAVEMYALLGDIYMFNSLFNPAALFEVLMGIGPGGGLSTAAQKNLSGLMAQGGIQGSVNESFYEWFGDPTMPFYNGPLNPWDMVGTHMLAFSGGTAGTPTAAYYCTN